MAKAKTKGRTTELGRLAAVALKKLPDGEHGDGGNLFFFVRGNSRTWYFRYTAPDGKRRKMGLGSLNDVSLSDARRAAAEYRLQLHNPLTPIDPLGARQASKTQAKYDAAKAITFQKCAETYIELQRPGWRNPKHVQQWTNTLTQYVYPTIGALAVGDVDTGLLVKCLSPIWTTKTETATRLRGRIEKILDWATASKYRHGENPARWRGLLENLLLAPKRIPAAKVRHHPALPYTEMGSFMAELATKAEMGARALQFLVLTAVRSGEVRGAMWSEIDLKNRVWVVPAERTKMKKEHRVPLSDSAMLLLKKLPRVDGTNLVFPSVRALKPLSDMTLTTVIRRINEERKTSGLPAWIEPQSGREIVPHGFRSAFRDWCSEENNVSHEVSEMALAHSIPNQVEAAYRRGDLFDKRRKVMQQWDKFCSTLPTSTAKVIPMHLKM